MDPKMVTSLNQARIDVKNYGSFENDVKVIVNEGKRCDVFKTWWNSKNGGAGYTIGAYDRHIAFELECVGNGTLRITLIGPNKTTPEGHSIPIWVDYTRFAVNGVDIFKEKKATWHNKPYVFQRKVSDGERVYVELDWEPHIYNDEDYASLNNLLNIQKQTLENNALIKEEEMIAKKKLHEKELKDIIPFVHITNKWASIKENDIKDLSQIIEKFDEGFYSVSIVNEKDKFLRVVNRYQFAQDFPRNKCRSLKNLYVNFDDDEKVLKHKLAELFLGTPRQEIPILSRGKIKALGRFSTYFDEEGRWDSSQVYKFDWKWIDEDVAKEFLSKYKNVLISSNCGCLKGFRDTFSKWLDIEVYSDRILDKCFSGKYDLVIDDSDIFNRIFPAKYYRAWRLYYMLLFETVRRWLNQRGISIHMISTATRIDGISEIKNRLSRMGEFWGDPISVLREGVTPYYVPDGDILDTLLGKDKKQPNYHSGRRCVTEAKSISGNGVYFYGPCIAIGYATYSPDKTIESCLQKIINKRKNIDYHVINCGTQPVMGHAERINWLHRLMDTPLRSGDIVIVLQDLEMMYGMESQFIPVNRHRLIHPFMTKENIKEKCFVEPYLAHINPRGYEIAANYIYELIQADFKEETTEDRRKSFFSTIPLSINENSRIGSWLKKLPMHPVLKSKDIGAIVLKADPLTKGHIYLVQQALKRCEFLYVFLTGGENSLLSKDLMKDIWIEFGKRNKINNVIICRLGSYMRKSYKYTAKFGFVQDVERYFNPVDDTHTFARYIAPILHIKKRFVGEEPFDTFKHRYNTIKHEILIEEGIEWVEMPRYRLADGREVITSNVREIWKKEGWKACKDYLPEEEIRLLEKESM